MGRGTTVLALFLILLVVWMSGCADVSFGSQQLGPREDSADNNDDLYAAYDADMVTVIPVGFVGY